MSAPTPRKESPGDKGVKRHAKFFGGWLATLVLAVAAAGSASAMPVGFDLGEGRLDLLSRYVWRGFDLAHGLVVAPSLRIGLAGQDVAGIGRDGLALELRGATPLRDRTRQRGADELDAGLWLTHAFDPHRQYEGRLGYVEYDYPSGRAGLRHARELAGTFTCDVQLDETRGIRVRPHVTLVYNVAAFDAPYVELGLGQSLGTRGKRLAYELRVAGSRFGQFNTGGNQAFGFHEAEFEVRFELEKQIAETHLQFGPVAGVSRAAKRINSDRNEYWWGASVGFRR
jgi:hypothetical protein